MQGMHLTVLSKQCVLLEPGLSLNPAEPDQYASGVMNYLQKNRTKGLIYDLKNLSIIDKTYYQWLKYLYTLCKLNNTQLVVINMKPTAAYGLSLFIDGFPPFKTALNVQDARDLID
jgi:anti-anti-sigma regulatory factor